MSNNLYERGEILKIAAHLWLLSLLIYPPLEPHNEDRNNRIREYPPAPPTVGARRSAHFHQGGFPRLEEKLKR